jgi:hypothetical protein
MPSTTEDLGDSLDTSLAWRRAEMHSLKSEIALIAPVSANAPRSRALRRSAVALLYAHWEGYTKDACQAYLDFVARRRLKFGELNDSFVLLGARRAAISVGGGDPGAEAKLIELVRGGSEMRAVIARAGVVNTKSNLRHDVLVDILRSLGLPCDVFQLKAALIDRSLCDLRNDIAHGRDACPTSAEFADLHDEVLGMMVDVQNLVISAAASGRYRYTT